MRLNAVSLPAPPDNAGLSDCIGSSHITDVDNHPSMHAAENVAFSSATAIAVSRNSLERFLYRSDKYLPILLSTFLCAKLKVLNSVFSDSGIVCRIDHSVGSVGTHRIYCDI